MRGLDLTRLSLYDSFVCDLENSVKTWGRMAQHMDTSLQGCCPCLPGTSAGSLCKMLKTGAAQLHINMGALRNSIKAMIC